MVNKFNHQSKFQIVSTSKRAGQTRVMSPALLLFINFAFANKSLVC